MNDALAEPIGKMATDAGAAESFTELYERTLPQVFGYVSSLLRDRSATRT